MRGAELFRLEPFDSINGALNVMQGRSSPERFTCGLDWPQQKFYVNPSYEGDGKAGSYEEKV